MTVIVKKIDVFSAPKTELKIRDILVRKTELQIRARVMRVWVNTRQICRTSKKNLFVVYAVSG